MSNDRYFLKPQHFGEWVEVPMRKFVLAERDAGFRPKYGGPGVATGGFIGNGMMGRVLLPGATAEAYASDPEFCKVAFPDIDAEFSRMLEEGA